MSFNRIFQRLLGLEQAVVEHVEFDGEDLVVHARPKAGKRGQCGRCGKRGPGYDPGVGRRRWRGLDLGTVKTWIEADAPRIECRACGVRVAAVPWARHGAGFTRDFDDQVAWLAGAAAKSTISTLMRIRWETVGVILTRVGSEIDAKVDRLDGLRRIGIDEVSFKKGQHYLTVVVDHDTGRLAWASVGANKDTLRRFFTELGPERTASLTHVSADAAAWIADVVTECAPQAVRCADPFHIVKWATDALDTVRRGAWNRARTRSETKALAKAVKRSRWALWKNPENWTDKQAAKIDRIAKTDPVLYRAWALKEGLRAVFAAPDFVSAAEALNSWFAWAQRSRIAEFVDLGRRVKGQLDPILASLEHGISNARTESTNTKIKRFQRIAFGFRDPQNLIALLLLNLGGHRPALPGRNP